MYCSIKIKFPVPGILLADAGGPYEGEAGDAIQFIGSAVGGLPPYTWQWDLGDGTTSSEKNPQHIYNTTGDYTATLAVTDSSNPANKSIDTALVTIREHPCDINISGGLGFTVRITNTGKVSLTNLKWNITLGGFIFPKHKSGTIPTLTIGANKTVHKYFLGLENVTIMVHAGVAQKQATAIVLFFFVKEIHDEAS